MFKSLFENVRQLLNTAEESQTLEQRVGSKRKRQAEDLCDAYGDDVEILKVEKRRKVEPSKSSSVTTFLKSHFSMMASWPWMKKNESKDTVYRDNETKLKLVTVSSNRNGNASRGSQQTGKELFYKSSTANYKDPDVRHRNFKDGNNENANAITSQNRTFQRSKSSSSSIFGNRFSTASACVRLKEREEYQKLLQSQCQGRLRSPWETRVTSHPTADLSGATGHSLHADRSAAPGGLVSSLLHSADSVLHSSHHHPVLKAARPIFTPGPKAVYHHPNADKTTNCSRNSTLNPVISREKKLGISNDHRLQNILSRQRLKALDNTSSRPLSGHKISGLHPEIRSDHIVIDDDPGDPVDPVSQRSRLSPSPIMVEDDKPSGVGSQAERSARVQFPITVEDDSSEVVHPARLRDVNYTGVNKQPCKRPEFLNSVYIKDDYLNDLNHSRMMSVEGRKRQIKEEGYKAKAYQEKRRAQEKSLEQQLKYKMRIFNEEPEVFEEIFLSSDEEEEEEDTLPELTDDMQQQISAALRPGNPNEVLAKGFNLQITRRDIATLAGLNWLNDEIINYYMNMLMERGGQEGRGKVWAFNTFFYPKIMSGGHQAVRRWTKKVDIFDMSYIVIPVHLGMHWCLCIVNMQEKVVTYYDSMGGTNNACLDAVLKYINDESVAKKSAPINMSEWSLVTADDNPQQMNGSDCGMFTCKYAEYLTRGRPISFSQEDMPYFRRRMVYEILTKELLQ